MAAQYVITISDYCVQFDYYFLILQSLTVNRSSSVYSFTTRRPLHLPIVDAGLTLAGDSSVSIGMELGPVCFSR